MSKEGAEKGCQNVFHECLLVALVNGHVSEDDPVFTREGARWEAFLRRISAEMARKQMAEKIVSEAVASFMKLVNDAVRVAMGKAENEVTVQDVFKAGFNRARPCSIS